MIIIDFNPIVIANFYEQAMSTGKVDLDLLRHMALNSIRRWRQKFHREYGEVVLANDSTSYWRREFFPYYKSHRKTEKHKSPLDWVELYNNLDILRNELKDNFPYKSICVDGAEADDIIAVLCTNYSDEEDIVIVSSDRDFIQLHNENVKQFDPRQNKWVVNSNPKQYLLEHILKGDRGDGIPNILSKDDCFINGRQTPCTRKFIENFESNKAKHQRNYDRNKTLIDLTSIPENISELILEQFAEQQTGDRSNIFNYFVEKRLRNLTEHINEF